MADARKRLSTNVEGNFFVDATCINCDTCRQLAPDSFEEVGEFSAVRRQPEGAIQLYKAYQALLACPTGSIGTQHSDKVLWQDAKAGFPLPLEGGVYYCGFNSEKSFGANSYFVTHPDGNWLVDSPRYIRHLVEVFQRMGGLRYIFLTHEDDVADAAKYAAHFRSIRIIHRADADAMPDAEWIVDIENRQAIGSDFEIIHVPGHTPGSQALLYKSRFLFTGDHLWWDPAERRLAAPRQLVWNQDHLLASIAKLADVRFEWVLAGHGHRVHLPAEEMQRRLRDLIERRHTTMVS
ncbi:MBL fold metallo-hydrolase [Nitrospira tepida]|uniref:MBL fold metallo-hydrolase n=1 Tax=Nitrospira tepida TaxID=2973512 RepID=A0AA86T0Y2_9BACT|nr:MBL fold metallo-hydrolase [Nitrospira tepida]CAI4029781.1 MBL fold metallo-hydrolase [Nitrospira tepida]